MEIVINGKKETIEDGMMLSKLLEAKKIRPEVVTVELNEEIIDRAKYKETKLKANDKLEFVYYMGGGCPFSDKIANDVTELIGQTPIVRINKVAEPGSAQIFAKLESFNPGGSLKDRICLSMLEEAEKAGLLKPGYTVIEPTSGNTGIGLAMVCAVKGYKCILTMPETMSLERIYILKSYGAEVVLTPGIEGMKGSIKKAEQLSKKIPHSFMPQQFKSKANPEVHKKTTAIEILDVINSEIHAFVATVGTGGTITGVSEVLKQRYPSVKIVAVEPKGSHVLSGGQPGPHKIQGIGAGFIPEILNRGIINECVAVSDDCAFKMTKRLAREEGLLVGISSGAAAYAAIKVAKDLGPNKVVVTIFPDTGERYFSMEQYFNA
ncbi:cysteine synthase A [Candidatus Saganbacteria bacterium]|nr:cysteine synthase A [Candidatus Saganbacteria bacterium]